MQEKEAIILLPGFAAASVTALLRLLETGEVSVGKDAMDDIHQLLIILQLPPVQACFMSWLFGSYHCLGRVFLSC